jgi:DNA repair photolyase
VRIIYEPRGRAREYAPLAVSLYRGCPHGCIYCFAPDSTRTDREAFCQSYARKNALNLLEMDAIDMHMAHDEREVLLSFTTDPYQPLDEELQMTRKAIEILISYGIHFTILTKGGFAAVRDFDLLAAHPDLCRFGTTLTLLGKDSKIWEPNARPPTNRIAALTQAKRMGIPTWVSFEPVIYPDQTLSLILDTLDIVNKKPGIVDEYRIGKFNHVDNPEVEQFLQSIGYQYPTEKEWRKFVQDAKTMLDEHGCRYIFKKDLQPYLQAAGVA